MLRGMKLLHLADKITVRYTCTRRARCRGIRTIEDWKTGKVILSLSAEIKIPNNANNYYQSQEDTIIHELAHAIEFLAHDTLRHDKKFIATLEALALLWYGDIKGYNWNREYASITRHAVNHGYTVRKAG